MRARVQDEFLELVRIGDEKRGVMGQHVPQWKRRRRRHSGAAL